MWGTNGKWKNFLNSETKVWRVNNILKGRCVHTMLKVQLLSKKMKFTKKWFLTQNMDFWNSVVNKYVSYNIKLRSLQIPDHILYPVTIIYILMFIMGVIGNVAVCLVIVHNKSMHTATNYYLFSLAISDLIILILGKKNWFNIDLIRNNAFESSIKKLRQSGQSKIGFNKAQ